MQPLFHIIHPEFGCHKCGQPDGRCLQDREPIMARIEIAELRNKLERSNWISLSEFVVLLGAIVTVSAVHGWRLVELERNKTPNRESLEWRSGIDASVLGIDRRIKKAIAERPIKLEEEAPAQIPPGKYWPNGTKTREEALAIYSQLRKSLKDQQDYEDSLAALSNLEYLPATQEVVAVPRKSQKFAIGDHVWKILERLPRKQGESVTMRPCYVIDVSSDGKAARITWLDKRDPADTGDWCDTSQLRHADLLEDK